MIKILLSSKIIKNTRVTYSEEGISVAEINLDVSIQNGFFADTDESEDDVPENSIDNVENVDIDQIRAEIRENISLENKQERQNLIDKALKEALKEAEILKKEAMDKGYKEGFREGYKKGITDCQVECNEIRKNALNMIVQAEKETKKYFKDNQENIIKLAGDMAESITQTVIDLSSENLLILIKPIIDLNDRNELIIITCHPDNYEFLKKSLEQLETSAPNARFVILSDNNLDKNGCVVENENQIIDLQIKKQVDSIIKDILSLED